MEDNDNESLVSKDNNCKVGDLNCENSKPNHENMSVSWHGRGNPGDTYNSAGSPLHDNESSVSIHRHTATYDDKFKHSRQASWTSKSGANVSMIGGATWPLAEGSGSLDICSIERHSSDTTGKPGNKDYSSSEDSIDHYRDESGSERKFSFRTLKRGQKIILGSVCLTNLLCFLSLSILAPFFPLEADVKHVNSTISGWIFGVFALVQFLISPLFGWLTPIVGSRFMYIAGLFMTAGCTLLFGLLGLIDTSSGIVTFVSLCFVTRIMLALGCTAVSNAGLIMLVKVFPDNVAVVFGIGEVFTGFGMVTGPALGGFLYGAGGFILPFAVIGGCGMVMLPIFWYMIPIQDDSSTEEAAGVSLISVLRRPKAIVNSIIIVMAASIWAVLDPTLEPHLRVYGLGPEIVGVLFLIMAAFYSVTAPVWGWVADKVPDNRAILVPGLLVCAAGLLLLGPSPVLGFDLSYNQLWLTILSLVILGIGSSMCVVPTYDIYVDVLSDIGCPEDTRSYGMVSGLWVSMYALGDFAGPSIAGFLSEEIGFEWLATWVAAACVLTTILAAVSWFADVYCCKTIQQKGHGKHVESTEKAPLLSSDGDHESDIMKTYPPATPIEYETMRYCT